MSLVDVVAGRSPVTPGEVLGLIRWLPEGSAYYASLRGGVEHRPWPLATVLAAGQLNALTGANWQRGGGKGERPKPITPPQTKVAGTKGGGNRGVKVRGATAARMAAMKAKAAGNAPPPQSPPAAGSTTTET